ncbi:uncharacterized protein TA15150 [Theileria annulata]|uniref:Uncharacterized protein n=1 Tax=Theileria annulata TaxID=5874 RepID=Q4UFC5_THEAN|nr:uncharacterized protein TA15150 [Theileria annulata]CAI74191.1 hypothetical protein TA15150 [Theileria annulata]|eukprot:XP_951923.1 hypothetical protein TA15150 [Theileria annulata]
MVNILEFEEFITRALGFTKTSEFNLSSYVGGLGFGTGLSLVFTKALRTIFVLASGGLLIILVSITLHIISKKY